MIISLTNGTKIELSSSEMTELAKHSVDMFSPMAVKTMEVVSPATTPKVGEVKRGRGRPRKDVQTPVMSTKKHKHHKARGGSIIDKIREHYGDNSIRHDSKLYLQEKGYYLYHGKKFSWEK
jgi:hypothetical protein